VESPPPPDYAGRGGVHPGVADSLHVYSLSNITRMGGIRSDMCDSIRRPGGIASPSTRVASASSS